MSTTSPWVRLLTRWPRSPSLKSNRSILAPSIRRLTPLGVNSNKRRSIAIENTRTVQKRLVISFSICANWRIRKVSRRESGAKAMALPALRNWPRVRRRCRNWRAKDQRRVASRSSYWCAISGERRFWTSFRMPKLVRSRSTKEIICCSRTSSTWNVSLTTAKKWTMSCSHLNPKTESIEKWAAASTWNVSAKK